MAWFDAPKERNHPGVQSYIDGLASEQRAVCLHVREILKEDPLVREFIAWGFPCYWRHGPLAYTKGAASHVTLGFFHGSRIEMGLKGSGKSPLAKFVHKLTKNFDESQYRQWRERAVEIDNEDNPEAAAQTRTAA